MSRSLTRNYKSGMSRTLVSRRTVEPLTGGPQTYAAYGDLPATAPDGTVAYVGTAPIIDPFIFVSAVDAHAFNMWVPLQIGSKFDAYDVDSSGDPWRLSMVAGVGVDDLAALQARGWAMSLGGSVADVSDTLQLTSQSGAFTQFGIGGTIASNDPGTYFVVMEGKVVSNVLASKNYGAVFGINDSTRNVKVTLTRIGIPGDVGFALSQTSQAASFFQQTAFDRLFMLYTITGGDGSNTYQLWRPNHGWMGGDFTSAVKRADFPAVGSVLFNFLLDDTVGNVLQVTEYHRIRLL